MWRRLITECRGPDVRGASEGLGLPLFDSRGDDAFFLEWDACQSEMEAWRRCTVYDAHQHVNLPPTLTCGHTAALVFDFGSIRRGQADRRTLTPHHQCCTLSAPV